VNRQALFKNESIDRTHGLQHAPKVIPKHLMSAFTMNGRLKVYEWYFDHPGEPSRDVLQSSPQSRRMTSSGSVCRIGVDNLLFDSSK
jgi:hypothetical protein